MTQILPNVRDAIHRLFANQRDEASFEVLFRSVFPKLCGFYRSKGLNEEDAKELAQDVMLSVSRNMATLRCEDQFYSWVFTIARNAFVNELERRNSLKRSALIVGQESSEPSILENVPDLAQDGLGSLLREERVQELRSALEELPLQRRRCVLLRVMKEMKYEEIALQLGISTNTVKAHLFQARQHLHDKLKNRIGKLDF